MNEAVVFNRVCIVFGLNPELALPLMDQGKSRGEIQQETRQIQGVHDCSLTVQKGEILTLMGLSGSGKSTLLRAVNGLNPITRGSLKVFDEDWSVNPGNCSRQDLLRLRRKTVAMVFQQFGLLPWRSVRDNVALGLELGGMKKAERDEKVTTQLELVGLSRIGSNPLRVLKDNIPGYRLLREDRQTRPAPGTDGLIYD